jgi:hypothetical protein
MILKGPEYSGLMNLDMVQKQEFAYLLLRMHGYGIGASQFLWGLYFFPFGMLVYRSGFIPRILAILMMITGLGYVVDSAAFILLQRPDYLLLRPFIMSTFIGGMLSILWFLVKGVREIRAAVNL